MAKNKMDFERTLSGMKVRTDYLLEYGNEEEAGEAMFATNMLSWLRAAIALPAGHARSNKSTVTISLGEGISVCLRGGPQECRATVLYRPTGETGYYRFFSLAQRRTGRNGAVPDEDYSVKRARSYAKAAKIKMEWCALELDDAKHQIKLEPDSLFLQNDLVRCTAMEKVYHLLSTEYVGT